MDHILLEMRNLAKEEFLSLLARFSVGSQLSAATSQQANLWNESSQLFNSQPEFRRAIYILVVQAIQLRRSSEAVKIALPWIDRFPTLIESASSVSELSALNDLLRTLLELNVAEVNGPFNRVLSKLVSTILRLMAQPEMIVPGLHFIETLLVSEIRYSLKSNINEIRNAVEPLLSNLFAKDIAVSVLAKSHAIDSPEVWLQRFDKYCEGLVALISEIGVTVQLDSALLKSNFVPEHNSLLTGFDKAIYMQRLIGSYASLILQLLTDGCTAGPVAIDLTVILSLIYSVLSFNIKVDLNDPKIHIQTNFNLSPAALASVLIQLKISSLELLKGVLQTNNSSLVRYSSVFRQCVGIMMNSSDFEKVPILALPTLQCLELVVRLFPQSTARNVLFGISKLVQMFETETIYLTKSNPLVYSTENESIQSIPFHHIIHQQRNYVIYLIEIVLLYCGQYLPVTSREVIDSCLNKCYDSLSKGIVVRQLTDKHIKRSPVELIRKDINSQRSLLSLGLVDVQSMTRTGIMGTNISKLKVVAAGGLQVFDLNDISTRILLLVDVILHPVNLILPSIAANLTVKGYVADIVEKIENVEATVDVTAATVQSSATEDVPESDSKSNKRKIEAAPTAPAVKSQKTKKADISIKVTKDSKKLAPSQKLINVQSKMNAKKAQESSDEDDDDIPDINLEMGVEDEE